MTVEGLRAGASFIARLFSDPVVLAQGTVAADGSASFEATLPEDLRGEHTLVVESSGTDDAEVVSLDTVYVADVPGAPTGLLAERSNAAAHIEWDAPSDDGGSGITGFQVFVDGVLTAETPDRGDAVDADLSGLANGQDYEIEVAALNEIGEGEHSSPISVRPATVPGSPGGLTAQRADRAVSLSWTAPTVTGGEPVTSYRILHDGVPVGER